MMIEEKEAKRKTAGQFQKIRKKTGFRRAKALPDVRRERIKRYRQTETPERMKKTHTAKRMEDMSMKRTILVTAFNFLGVIAVWVFLELLYTQFTGGIFIRNLLNPVYMSPCGIAALITAIFAFMDEKKRAQEITTYGTYRW